MRPCEALDSDRDFLKQGGVFNDDQSNGYLELKAEEYTAWDTALHPTEYMMYYSA